MVFVFSKIARKRCDVIVMPKASLFFFVDRHVARHQLANILEDINNNIYCPLVYTRRPNKLHQIIRSSIIGQIHVLWMPRQTGLESRVAGKLLD